MKIYSITLKNKRNSNVFIVSTEKGDFDFHSDILVRDRIEKGEVDDENFFSSHAESLTIIAFNIATKYIASKLKTEQQIKDYLYKKEFHKSTVESVIEKLKEYKIIDDENYAKTYAESNPKFSRNKLKQKLFSCGVNKDVVEESVEDVDDFSSCVYHAEKYLKNKVADKQTIDKMVRRLQGMGYNWDAIRHALNKVKCDVEEE